MKIGLTSDIFLNFRGFIKAMFNGENVSVISLRPQSSVLVQIVVVSEFSPNMESYLRRFQYTPKLVFISGEPRPVSDRVGPLCSLIIDCKKWNTHMNIPHIFFPFFRLSFFERRHHTLEQLLSVPQIYPTKTKFCAYLSGKDVPHRVDLFRRVSTYKPVDALGKSMNPAIKSRSQTDRGRYDTDATYNDLAVKKFLPYKFVICCENTLVPGYVTEKIISAMLAGCIPIYMGAPDIDQYVNIDKIIQVLPETSTETMIEQIRLLDTNDELYRMWKSLPWTDVQKNPFFYQMLSVSDYFKHAIQTYLK